MSSIEELRDKLRQILGPHLNNPNVRRGMYSPVFEERAEDIRVANIPEDRLERIYEIDNVIPQEIDRVYFVDGTLRTVNLGGHDIVCNGINVPIFASQIVVGATVRENRQLRPFRYISRLIIMAPSNALSGADCHSIYLPDDITLDYRGDFYRKIMNSDILFTDISLRLQTTIQGNPISSIKPNELIGTGKIRRAARNRAKVIMRIMELLLAYEISRQNKDDLIVMDGPIGILLPYSRLTGVINLDLDEYPSDKYTPRAQSELYNLLNNVIGIVKNVVRIPSDLRINSGIQFYSFPSVSGLVKSEDEENIDEDDLRSYIIAGYMRLRPNILREIPIVWSLASALIRIDVPLPVIIEPSLSDKWLSFFKQRVDQTNLPLVRIISDYIRSSTYSQQRLSQIASYVASEAYPIPSTSPHRMLVELYPIAETEYWIKSKLLSPEELVSLI